MRASHDLARVTARFDDASLVPSAGLLTPAILTQRLDVAGLIDRQDTCTPSSTPQSISNVSPGAHTPGRRPRCWSRRHALRAVATSRRKLRADPAYPAARASGNNRFADSRPFVAAIRCATTSRPSHSCARAAPVGESLKVGRFVEQVWRSGQIQVRAITGAARNPPSPSPPPSEPTTWPTTPSPTAASRSSPTTPR